MRLTRLILVAIILVIISGFHFLLRTQLDEVAPRTFQATEESMIDTAQILAAMIGQDLDPGPLPDAFDAAHQRQFRAKIYEHLKTEVGLGCLITDAEGIVVFDSHDGRDVGKDYSTFNDVARTLKGEYGARSSRIDEEDSSSSVLFVAAPIGDPLHPSGVLSLSKPQADVLPIVNRRRIEIFWGTGLIGIGILCFVTAVFVWQYRPVGLLTDYARAIEEGKRPALPQLGAGREVNTLARALESMREALEGRQYAERYVQTLTHEMKSPLAAIRGAAELLDEDMPAVDRERFLGNIRAEALRADRLLNRLLELSALEGRSGLDASTEVDLREITLRAIDHARPIAELAGVELDLQLPKIPVPLRGDAFILRSAITNLLENAIDFSPEGETVRVRLERAEALTLIIEDRGPGIPDYARERIFERFFSLRQLNHARKGTGLGLTLVKEAAELHGGSITLSPATPHGTRAVLMLPA
ncbi:two-component system sensor histidine kinase CreC [Haloferula luteola]|uniref:histidine kinase n=1 Tax=Haloferula luteola TaxID=595692 RepID=A0A840V0B4_9BACT|nr:two-component system sensor histidine kinase CreC [Haloferula luteola]MBB5351807.1 two-component system sensor histidine kinase CreC [Haloferula luteola]